MRLADWWLRLKSKPLGDVIKHKHRFVVMDTDTFKEKFSFQLSGTNLFVTIGITVIVLILLTTILIAFTPLREWIPGYTDTKMVEQTYDNARRVDSLEAVAADQEWLIAALQAVITGDPVLDAADMPPADSSASLQAVAAVYRRSKEDSLLRLEVEQEDNRYQLKAHNASAPQPSEAAPTARTYFAPLRGDIVRPYNPAANHYGIDIAAAANQPVVAAYSGTVVAAHFTAEAGHVVTLQHPGNIITTYRNNSAVMKRQGDIVRSGEPIAFAGGSPQTTGSPHLHFEMWINGAPVNPEEYISF